VRWENGVQRLSSVTEIVAAYLRAEGYDGLYNDDTSQICGCMVDYLCPCSEDMSGCKPGYKCACDDDCRFDGIGPVRGEEATP
jgi:hypothetical protein